MEYNTISRTTSEKSFAFALTLLIGMGAYATLALPVEAHGRSGDAHTHRTTALTNARTTVVGNVPEESNAPESLENALNKTNANNSGNGSNGGASAGEGGNGGNSSPGGLVKAGGVVTNSNAVNVLNTVLVRISSRQ